MNYTCTAVQGVTYYNRAKAYNGYTLFTPGRGRGDVWLVSMEGRIVHHWRMPYPPGLHGKFLPNGNLLYACKILGGPLDDFGGSCAKLIEVNWDGKIVWEYDDPYMSHDFYRMKNGNTMVIRWVETPDEVAKKVKGGLPGTERQGIMWSDALREVTPDGKVVWEWIAYEHLDLDTFILCPLCGRARFANANSVFVMKNDDVLVSQRMTNMLFIIDKATGNIKWQWGPGIISHSHDAQELENGNIIVFDNGIHRNCENDGIPSYSRIPEVNPKTKEIVWEYKEEVIGNFYSYACAGCQRLPNGNTLICEAMKGRIFEVTSEGETVWEYASPFYYNRPPWGVTNFIFRAYRFGPDFEGLRGKDLSKATEVAGVSKRQIIEERTKKLGY